MTEEQIRAGIEALTLDELVGQVLCYEVNAARVTPEVLEEVSARTQPGGAFVHGQADEYRETVQAIMRKNCHVPPIFAADIESGIPGFPNAMGWSAADDAALAEEANRAVGKYRRRRGISLALGPVVDINYNLNNALVNVRSLGDSPDQVIKIGTAMVRGFQKDGVMAACVKHFPGDGVDERNQHFLTSVNSLSKEEWMNTYGRVYKAMIEAGTMAIMVAHIALPAYDEKIDDYLGYPPGTLSRRLMTDLLKGELGFKGCIVSDAMSMIGACAMVDCDRLAVEYLKAGGDMVLFALPTDFDHIKQAVLDGDLPLERLKDAVTRIWRLKNGVHLFEGEEAMAEALELDESTLETYADRIAERSVRVVRNADDLFPATYLQPGAKILQVVICEENRKNPDFHGMTTVEEELKKRGYEVTTLKNPMHYDVKNAKNEYDLVLFDIRIHCGNYNCGTMRIGWDQVMALWRGYLLQHKRVLFTSFGDPYKLYDYPFARNYVNVFSDAASTQRAFVKALLGEIPAVGKNPVSHPGFFERDTQ